MGVPSILTLRGTAELIFSIVHDREGGEGSATGDYAGAGGAELAAAKQIAHQLDVARGIAKAAA